MGAKTAKRLAWIAWILVLLGSVSGVVAAMALLGPVYQQIAAGVGTVCLLVAGEIRRQLPSSKTMSAPQPETASGTIEGNK